MPDVIGAIKSAVACRRTGTSTTKKSLALSAAGTLSSVANRICAAAPVPSESK